MITSHNNPDYPHGSASQGAENVLLRHFNLAAGERLLAGLPLVDIKGQWHVRVSEQDPHLVSHGEHAIVLREEASGQIVKFVGTVRKEADHSNDLFVPARTAMESGLPIELMVDTLREVLGPLDVTVPDHHEFTVTRNIVNAKQKKESVNLSFHVCPDLSDNGRSEVVDAQGFMFAMLNNGTELQRQFHDAVTVICNLPASKYTTAFEGHRVKDQGEDTFRYAVEKMFFVVYDPFEKRGSLVAGDLDHVAIIANQRFLDYYRNSVA